MDKKNLVKRVAEKIADKTYTDIALLEPIKDLATDLKNFSEESVIKEKILQFFKFRKLNTEKQAYVLITLIRTYDMQLKSPTHKKVLKDLAKKNTFIDIIF